MSSAIDNKRIAKNTIFLYIRMIVMIGITFYTSRIILEALGVDDFGVYNIVGGIVVLFSFLNTSMTNASQRFISYELGKNDGSNVKKVFSTSVNCHILVAIILVLLAESIGLWFVTHIIKVPENAQSSALVVYQCCIFISIISIIQVPFNAAIISYENMKIYSYISIAEAVLKLIVVFIVFNSTINRLIEYAILNVCVAIIIFVIYSTYVYLKFINCRYSLCWDKTLFKTLMSFSGWSMVNGSATIISQQGGNILLNSFYGVAVNAAYGIGSQVSSAINGFVTNFQLAFRPQIVKLYANNNISEETFLINRASKYSFFLMMLLFVPFVINGQEVLRLWLKDVPEYSCAFCVWILVYLLIDAAQAPIWMAIYATGKIKRYTIGACIFTLLNIPLSYVFLLQGFSPVIVLIVRAFLNLLFSIYRLYSLKALMSYPILPYMKMLLSHALPCLIISLALAFVCKYLFPNTIAGFVIVTILSIIITVGVIMAIGLESSERNYILTIIKYKIIKKK